MEQITQSIQLFTVQLKINNRKQFFNKDVFSEKELHLTKLFPFVQEKLSPETGVVKYYELDNNKRGRVGMNQRSSYKYVLNTRQKDRIEFCFQSINLLVFKDDCAYLLLTVESEVNTIDQLTTFNYFFAETKDRHNFITFDENVNYTLNEFISVLFERESYSYLTDLSENGSTPDVKVFQMTQLSGESISIQEASQYYDIHRNSYIYDDNEEEFIKRYHIVRPYRSLEFGVSVKGVSALCKTLGVGGSDAFLGNQFKVTYFTNYMFIYIMLLHMRSVLLTNFSNYSNYDGLFDKHYVTNNYKQIQGLYFAFTETAMAYQLQTPSFERHINSFYNSLAECLEINSLTEKQNSDLKLLARLLNNAKEDIKSEFSKKIKIISGLITFILSCNSAILSLVTVYIASSNTKASLILSIVGCVLTFITAIATFLILVLDTKGPKGKKHERKPRDIRK